MNKNIYTENSVLKRCVEALETTAEQSWANLPGMLRDIARKGKPDEIQFNHIRIRYITQVKGFFCLSWFVTNGTTSNNKVLYSKDYIGKTGKLRYQDLARDMRKI